MSNLHILKHPLIGHKITMLRNKDTAYKDFKDIVTEISTIICYEATKEAPTKEISIETPIQQTTGTELRDKFAIIPILRAGLGMVEGVMRLLPTARVGHIGLYRDPQTLDPVEYYVKLPADIHDMQVFLCDPMVATGNSASEAIRILKDHGAKDIKLLCLVSCPEGVAKITADHPDITIYTAAHDPGLNDKSYIVPGLGDAGDRLYGTL